MADLNVSVPECAQNIVGVATTKAPLERMFEACTDETLGRLLEA